LTTKSSPTAYSAKSRDACASVLLFLADRTNGRAYATMLRLFVCCLYIMHCS